MNMTVQKPKIVHCISSLALGGAERMLVSLIIEMKEYEHHVIFFHNGPLRQELIEHGIQSYKINLFSFIHLYKKINSLNPILIHSSLWAANFLCRIISSMTDIPIVCSVHTLCAHEGTIRAIFEKLNPCQPSRYIAVSKSVKKSLECSRHIKPENITVIPNGIALNKKSTILRYDSTFTIGTVGRLVPVKNYDFLIRCFADLVKIHPNCKLVIVGSGPEFEKLSHLTQQLSLTHNVEFTGAKKSHDYYPVFDCFVQPSSYEGLSLALLEAMSYELPVIVTGDNHDVITHNNEGIIVPQNNKKEFVNALKQLIENVDQRKKLAREARDLVYTDYSLSKTLESYRALFNTTAHSNL